jgi:outer membrane protein OmpA-like peptidoglycan-associated protein
VDSRDKCPNTPVGTPVDADGCELEHDMKLEGVNFEFDSAKLTSDSIAKLEHAVATLKRNADDKIEIAGHTDSQGNDEYNMGLSQRRAQAVADYLISKGANANNLTVKGYGETHPVADNGSKEGRAANRRVELRH